MNGFFETLTLGRHPVRRVFAAVFLVVLMIAGGALRPAAAQTTATVAGTFAYGMVGTQGVNVGVMENLYNFSSLDLRVAFFVFDESGYGGTQGNDDAGFVRILTNDDELIDVSGSITWQIKDQGRTVYIGLIPDTAAPTTTISTPIGPYTIGPDSSFAIRLPGETMTFADGTTVNGSANPPDMTVVPTSEVTTAPGPPALASSNAVEVYDGETDVFTYTTNEWVTWNFSGGADSALFDLDPETGNLTFLAPPSYAAPADADGDNVYHIEITAWDADGESSTQTMTVTVLPALPRISSSKSVEVLSLPTEPFDCATDAPLPGANIYTPGVCIEYRVDVTNAALDSASAANFTVTDQVPGDLTAILIRTNTGFDTLSLSGNTVSGTITSFDPGDTAMFAVRAVIN